MVRFDSCSSFGTGWRPATGAYRFSQTRNDAIFRKNPWIAVPATPKIASQIVATQNGSPGIVWRTSPATSIAAASMTNATALATNGMWMSNALRTRPR